MENWFLSGQTRPYKKYLLFIPSDAVEAGDFYSLRPLAFKEGCVALSIVQYSLVNNDLNLGCNLGIKTTLEHYRLCQSLLDFMMCQLFVVQTNYEVCQLFDASDFLCLLCDVLCNLLNIM